MSKERERCKCNVYAHMAKYHQTRKVTSKLQCNFQWSSARMDKQNKKSKIENNSEKTTIAMLVIFVLVCCVVIINK